MGLDDLGQLYHPKASNNLLTPKQMTRAGADLGFFKGGRVTCVKGG